MPEAEELGLLIDAVHSKNATLTTGANSEANPKSDDAVRIGPLRPESAHKASNTLRTLKTEKEEYGDWAEVLDWAHDALPYDSTTLQVIESYQDGLIPIADYEGRLDMVARMLKAEAAKAARAI